MKTYKSSDLTHKRAEVMREAELNGVIIQECRTNGEVVKEFVLTQYVKPKEPRFEYDSVKGLSVSVFNQPLMELASKFGQEPVDNKGDL